MGDVVAVFSVSISFVTPVMVIRTIMVNISIVHKTTTCGPNLTPLVSIVNGAFGQLTAAVNPRNIPKVASQIGISDGSNLARTS